MLIFIYNLLCAMPSYTGILEVNMSTNQDLEIDAQEEERMKQSKADEWFVASFVTETYVADDYEASTVHANRKRVCYVRMMDFVDKLRQYCRVKGVKLAEDVHSYWPKVLIDTFNNARHYQRYQDHPFHHIKNNVAVGVRCISQERDFFLQHSYPHKRCSGGKVMVEER